MPVPAVRRLLVNERRVFGRLKNTFPAPPLTEIQTESYKRFLQLDVPAEERQDIGLESVLRETWLNFVKMFEREHLVIGGKSMGGRIASLIADEAKVAGLVCLGYPFHPAGKPDRLRVEHLRTIQTPTLILQGTRDSFGNRDEVAGYRLSPSIRVHWLDDGNHDFTPRKASGRTEQQNWNEGIAAVTGFVNGC